MAVPRPQEIATVTIDGSQYSTWESVFVEVRWLDGFPVFMVSVSEPTPSPVSFVAQRFSVGKKVVITLAGKTALTGVITMRQSAADADRHGVQLIGKGLTWQMVKSSILPKDSNFDNNTILQIAQRICGEVSVSVAPPIGTLNLTPFEKLQAVPGEPSWDFLEKAARQREVLLGSDEFGNLVLIGQNSPPQPVDTFVEGGANRNIKHISVTISNDTLFQNYLATGQNAGGDETWGPAAAQIAATLSGSDPLPSNIVIPVEEPGPSGSVQARLLFEGRIREGTHVEATIVTPGWLRSGGDLWQVGQMYNVVAPDHFPGFDNGIILSAKTVTFQQNEAAGTTTTLELVLPWLLNGNLLVQTGTPSAPQQSDAAPLQ